VSDCEAKRERLPTTRRRCGGTEVSGDPGGFFTVVLRWKKASSVRIQLSEAEAASAVKKFKSRTGYDPGIFDKVQKALLDLEGKASLYPTVS
jgi:hypothetical protein